MQAFIWNKKYLKIKKPFIVKIFYFALLYQSFA